MLWHKVQNLFRQFLTILYPRKELIEELESLTAEEFIQRIPRAPFISSSVTAFFIYRHSLMRQAIWEIKYANNTKVFKLLGEVLALLLPKLLENTLKSTEIDTDEKEICIIPLPLSKERFRERGYNQTEKLAEAMQHFFKNKNLEAPFTINTSILQKNVHTISQTKMIGRQNRLQNVKGSFQAIDTHKVETPNKDNEQKEKLFIILDDVTTTGATLEEAADALRASGARRVLSIALAH